MGCYDSFSLCSFPHGREEVRLAVALSLVAWICTIASMDAHGLVLSSVTALLVLATTSTQLSIPALSCAAVMAVVTAVYNIRTVWLIGHAFGECQQFEDDLHSTKAQVDGQNHTIYHVPFAGHNETFTQEDIDETEFLCNDLTIFMFAAALSSPLWFLVAVNVLHIPQPGHYTTLMELMLLQQSQAGRPKHTAKLFRGCCRSVSFGSFPHGTSATYMSALVVSLISTIVATFRHRLETTVLSVLATSILYATTTTTVAPIVLHMAAVFSLLTSFYAFQAAYYVERICPELLTAKDDDESWMPDWCVHPHLSLELDVTTGMLWLVTGLLVFTIPPPLQLWTTSNEEETHDLELAEEEAVELHHVGTDTHVV